MYTEILQHCTFCRNLCKEFRGRETLLDKAKLDMQNSMRGGWGSQPFVMYGPSGSGKMNWLSKKLSCYQCKNTRHPRIYYFIHF